MVKRPPAKHKYALSCLLSSTAGLLGLFNPILSSMLVKRAKESFLLMNLLPVIICLVAVKLTRMYLRISIAKLLGGSQRAPFIWLQHRIGRWLWWLEPMLHNWGWVGMAVTRFSGSSGLAPQVASSVIYTLSDTGITVISGVIFYYTENYVLSFLSVLILPTLIVIPWFTEKSAKIRKKDREEAACYIPRKGHIR